MTTAAPTVAVLGCTHSLDHDDDEEPLLAALGARGLAASAVAWDRPGLDPAAFDACLLRSTWNYHLHPERFLRWIERAGRRSRLWNPADVVAWNAHKRYLLELAARDVAVVPTRLVARGAAPRLERAQELRRWRALGWSAVVVKPAVSGSSWRTRRFEAHELAAAQVFLAELAAERDALLQPCLPAFEESGERCVVWIDGAVTHVVQKRPRFAGQSQRARQVPLEPQDAAFCRTLLAPFAERILYARVDFVRDADGRPRLAELELIEPSLFLREHPSALERLADALERRLRRAP